MRDRQISKEEMFLNALEGRIYRIREAGNGTNRVTKKWLSFYEAINWPLMKCSVGYTLEKYRNGKWRASNWTTGG